MSVSHTAKRTAWSFNGRVRHPVPYDGIERETKKAILFKLRGKKVWLPKSQVTLDSKAKIVHIPMYLINKSRLGATHVHNSLDTIAPRSYPSNLRGYGNQPLLAPKGLKGSTFGPASAPRRLSKEEIEAWEKANCDMSSRTRSVP